MQIKKIIIYGLISFFPMTIVYAKNSCPLWLPMPMDDLTVVIPIYNQNIVGPDLDCDGIIDSKDNDIDGDGVPNALDDFPRDVSESVDTDGDRIGNNADTDDDNDGYSDIEEIAAGSDPLDPNSIPNNVIVLNELKAFPTAEGAGANASGGRRGKVIYVTNRRADGNGSLRKALQTQGRRTIVFAIGGRFNVDKTLQIGHSKQTIPNIHDRKYGHFTLAGQTANKLGGVHLAHSAARDSDAYISERNATGDLFHGTSYFAVYNQEDMILRYFDSRYNWNWFLKKGKQGKAPTLKFTHVNDLIIDHITSGWSAYGLIILSNRPRIGEKILGNITIQRSLMHENIVNPDATTLIPELKNEYQTNHNVGMLLGKDPLGPNGPTMTKAQWDNMGEFSIHKNAFIGESHRFPNTSGGKNGKFRIINNYIYGFKGDATGERIGRFAGSAQNDLVANVYQLRPYTNHLNQPMNFASNNLYGYLTNETPDGSITKANFHVRDNLFLHSDASKHLMTEQIKENPYLILFNYSESNPNHSTRKHLTKANAIYRENPISSSSYPVSIIPSATVKENILANVGGNVRFSDDGLSYIDDDIDNRYIGWAKNNNGPESFTSKFGDGMIGDFVGNEENPSGFKYPTNSHYNADTNEQVDPTTFDNDVDGIPDTWEIAHGLKVDKKHPNNVTVRANRTWHIGKYTVINNAGYTDLEIYLADIAGDFHMLAQHK